MMITVSLDMFGVYSGVIQLQLLSNYPMGTDFRKFVFALIN